ncbi:UDP-glucose/GDP-mannose dehydrogenase family protein [Novosphingobium panipatense]|uniref:UDP-glucose dehydrogenase family protein n=1 Tax=Novosphingobium panipatense TaxID=428991 RepID=UPI0039A1A5B9
MRIGIVGTGYVGLVSGACLADYGHEVVCIDTDQDKIARIGRGIMPIFEPGLDTLVASNVAAGRLSFATDIRPALTDVSAVFIAVGTPSRRGDGHADLSYVYAAAREIAAEMSGPGVIITKSTVPVGTGDEIERIVAEVAPGKSIAVASNPEFLREGAAIEDFKRPDRIVIGCEDELAESILTEIYRPLSLNQSAPVLVTRRRDAELIKYAANAFLAVKIAYINEIADLCEAVGGDVQQVAKGIGFDQRIGSKFLNAGPGYGGSCFPKDTLALLKTADDYQAHLRIVEAAVKANDLRKRAMARKVIGALGEARGRTVALLGLTFKPNTDDMRDAPSLAIVAALQDAGVNVRAYDPEGMDQARAMLPGVAFCTSAYEAADGADALVLVTEWDEFRALDLDRMTQLLARPLMVDLRNIYKPEEARRAGLYLVGLGKPNSGPVLVGGSRAVA